MAQEHHDLKAASDKLIEAAKDKNVEDELAIRNGELMRAGLAGLGAPTRPSMAAPTPPPRPNLPDVAAIKAAAGPRMDVQPPQQTQRSKVGVASEKIRVTLDPIMILKIELALTKQALAQKDQEVAIMALREAKRREAEAKKEEQIIRAQIGHQVGQPIGDITLIDKDQGICEVMVSAAVVDAAPNEEK